MKLYIDDKEYSFSADEVDYMYENEGSECVVYRFKDEVLKVYKDYCRKDRLDLESVKTLSKIKSKRILLPKKPLYDEDRNFNGYVMNYIESYALSNISKMKMAKFLEELGYFQEDLKVFAENRIDIDDVNRDNMGYNGGIYLRDPGSYIIQKDWSFAMVMKSNQKKINEFFCEEVIIPTISLSKREKANIKEHFLDSDSYIGDVMAVEAKPEETVRSYVKRICK